MNNFFFPKLAADNVRKNKMTYLPYILTCILTVSIYYIVMSLSENPGLEQMTGSKILASFMTFGCDVIALFALIFLFYTNSFLIKRRKKEFAVFRILGMEKKHLAVTFAWETVYVACISLSAGILLGIAFDKAMFLLIAKIVDAKAPLGFFLSLRAVFVTILLFCLIFLCIFLYSVWQIKSSSPMNLLRDSSAGEKEPKTKRILAVLGVLCVGCGYYISITTENPITSIPMFFIAVLLVIFGTYLLFTAGSVALLKILRKNKRYYYQTRHFTSVSGLIYRMKQNAVGLANICILSTMVLVMVSSTSSLMIGMEDILETRYPNDFTIYAHSDNQKASNVQKSFDEVRGLLHESGIPVDKEIEYSYFSTPAIQNGNSFDITDFDSLGSDSSLTDLIFIPLSDYNRCMGTNKTLKEGESLIYTNRFFDYSDSSLHIMDETYVIKEKLDDFMGNGEFASSIVKTLFLVVPDETELLKKEADSLEYYFGFDTNIEEDETKHLFDVLRKQFSNRDFTIEAKQIARINFLEIYGGLFFIGIFLGILFSVATVLIIYYKQISEGYDDKERFEIMQKVGMNHREVKYAIRSQVLIVFFLPLIIAGIHMAAAFPLVSRMLALFNLGNIWLYIACTGICFLAFAVMYMSIYFLTAKTYYRIVRR